MADGIGFVFSNKLPCAKNIQRIQSLFISRKVGVFCPRSIQPLCIPASAHPVVVLKSQFPSRTCIVCIRLQNKTRCKELFPSLTSPLGHRLAQGRRDPMRPSDDEEFSMRPFSDGDYFPSFPQGIVCIRRKADVTWCNISLSHFPRASSASGARPT